MAPESTRLPCPACGAGGSTERYLLPPRRVLECRGCGHQYACVKGQQPTPKYTFTEDEADTINTNIDMAYLQSVFARYGLRGCRLLDIGCGHGRIEARLMREGWPEDSLHVVDSDPGNVAHVRQRLGLRNAHCQAAEQTLAAHGRFDCVLMLEFLEHVLCPREALQRASEVLIPGGFLIIRALPNPESLEAYIGKSQWKLRAIATHYQFFTQRSMKAFVSSFPELTLVEWGCFLQPGFSFYGWRRLARNLGIRCASGREMNESEIQGTLMERIFAARPEKYTHWTQPGVSDIGAVRTIGELEEYFDRVNQNYLVSPDVGVILRKGP